MTDLLVRNAALATLEGPAGPRGADSDVGLKQGWSVAVEGSRIAWVGPDNEWDGTAGRVLDAAGNLVTPGFVDPHTHLVYAGDRAFELGMKLQGRSYLDILEAGGGIAHTVAQTRAASPSQLVEQTLPRLRRMLRAGTTSLEAKSGYGLDTRTELKQLKAGVEVAEATGVAMAHTFLGAHAVPEEHKGHPERYVDQVVDEMLPAVAKQGIARFCDVFVEKGVFTPEQGLRILEAGKHHGLRPRLHADEIVNTGGAELAAKVGAASADHLLRVGPEGIQAMADAGTIATLLPTVPITLFAPEWAPAQDFLAAGVPIALATDHNPNNPVTDMNLVCQLGCYLLRLRPEQALTAATWNAACSLGMEERVGSIEVGKQADLLIHDVPDLEHWIQEPGRRTVQTVVLGGQIVEPQPAG